MLGSNPNAEKTGMDSGFFDYQPETKEHAYCIFLSLCIQINKEWLGYSGLLRYKRAHGKVFVVCFCLQRFPSLGYFSVVLVPSATVERNRFQLACVVLGLGLRSSLNLCVLTTGAVESNPFTHDNTTRYDGLSIKSKGQCYHNVVKSSQNKQVCFHSVKVSLQHTSIDWYFFPIR